MTFIGKVFSKLAIDVESAIQVSVGFGKALAASRAPMMIDPGFVQMPYMLSSLFLSVSMVRRERGAVDLRSIKVGRGGPHISEHTSWSDFSPG